MDGAAHDTLILSDLHLGSHISRAQAAMRMLKETSFRRLILLGDIFSDLNFGRLTKPHWKFLGYIRKLSNPKRGIEVVWVEGNHDRGLSNIMSHLVETEPYRGANSNMHSVEAYLAAGDATGDRVWHERALSI